MDHSSENNDLKADRVIDNMYTSKKKRRTLDALQNPTKVNSLTCRKTGESQSVRKTSHISFDKSKRLKNELQAGKNEVEHSKTPVVNRSSFVS